MHWYFQAHHIISIDTGVVAIKNSTVDGPQAIELDTLSSRQEQRSVSERGLHSSSSISARKKKNVSHASSCSVCMFVISNNELSFI